MSIGWARVDEKVDLLGAMMNRVKVPQERNLVTQPVPPIISHVSGHQPRDHARPDRQRSGRRQQTLGNDAVHRPRQHADRHAQQHCQREAAEKVVAEIDDDPFAKHFLRTRGEQRSSGTNTATRIASHAARRRMLMANA